MTKRILYVEDDSINALIMQKLLRPDFEVIHVFSGEDCLLKLEQEPFELVLMDINLGRGKMDGVETLRQMRSKMEIKDLPVFAVTSYAMPEDEARFLNEGFNRYVAKPVDRAQLLHLISSFFA